MSGFKTYIGDLPWTERREWCWPENDNKLHCAFDTVADIDVIMECVEGRDVCVQAGGACGIWPLRFSQLFATVYTFEPDSTNYQCLLENIQDADNIVPKQAALVNDSKRYTIKRHPSESRNCGAGYVEPNKGGDVQGVKIDDLCLDACDLIQLDIEGFELVALHGARQTIEEFSPVIVLEEKALPQFRGDPARARKWLDSEYGYKKIATVRRDVILVV